MWIQDFMDQFGYFAVGLLVAIENLFPPIPSEVILGLGGFYTVNGKMTFWGVFIASVIGAFAGAVILYMLGRLLSVERLKSLFDSRFGKILHLRASDVDRANAWFVKRGTFAVFFGRFVPVIRSLISIPAGTAKMPFWIFAPLTIVGSSIWNIVLVYAGNRLGANWEKIIEFTDTYTYVGIAILVVALIAGGAWFYKRRFIDVRREQEKNAHKD